MKDISQKRNKYMNKKMRENFKACNEIEKTLVNLGTQTFNL